MSLERDRWIYDVLFLFYCCMIYKLLDLGIVYYSVVFWLEYYEVELLGFEYVQRYIYWLIYMYC